jgi:hypothetical protein
MFQKSPSIAAEYLVSQSLGLTEMESSLPTFAEYCPRL